MSDIIELTEAVTFQQQGHYAVITINRPQARNAVNGAVANGIEAGIDRLEETDDLWVGIVTGVPPVFCAGADEPEAAAGVSPEVAEVAIEDAAEREASPAEDVDLVEEPAHSEG